MPIILMSYIKRGYIREWPDILYVFGDNFAQSGFGGQARECRGEPNTIGIPTKRLPSAAAKAYLTDLDIEEWRHKAAPAFAAIEAALARGDTVVFPEAGLGTGLAQLETRAPAIWAELQAWVTRMKAEYEPEMASDGCVSD